MSRPPSEGLGYFPLDCDIEGDKAVRAVETRFGSDGFAVFVKLLARVYRGKGYWLLWDESECDDLARATGMDPDRIQAIVIECVARRLFDARIFESHRILTSHGIQKRFKMIAKRRKESEILPELLLTETPFLHTETPVSVDNNLLHAETPLLCAETHVTDDTNPTSGDMSGAAVDGTQRKGKEIKDPPTPQGQEGVSVDINNPPLWVECHDLLRDELGTVLTGVAVPKVKRMCVDYAGAAPSALDRVRYGIEEARRQDKPNVLYALACAANAGAEQVLREVSVAVADPGPSIDMASLGMPTAEEGPAPWEV